MYIDNSASYIIIRHIEGLGKGAIFDIDDCMGLGISYTHLRSIFVELLSKKRITRIARGLYCNPKIVNGTYASPSLDSILKYISVKSNFEYCAADEYAEYVLGLRESMPNIINCYITGKIKYVNLTNGQQIVFTPRKRAFTNSFSCYELFVLFNYISLENKKLSKETIKELKTKDWIINATEKDISSFKSIKADYLFK